MKKPIHHQQKYFLPVVTFALFLPVLSKGQTFFDPTTPQTLSEFTNRNRQIALTFGPALYQWVGTCDSDSEDGDGDRILKVNYDGNWEHLDNWENLEFLNNPSNNTWDIRPTGYYAVTWTPEVWIIVYTFYYTRDWAFDGGGFPCSDDEHEGDFAKAFIVVKRPDSQYDEPKDLIVGFAAGGDHKENCINIKDENESLDDANAIEREDFVHPIVSSAAGSHHYYSKYSDGHKDGGANPCKPLPTGLLRYTPAWGNYPITTTLSDLSPLQECIFAGLGEGICIDLFSPADVVSCSYNEENYNLIDIFDSNQGLWAQRTNEDLFTNVPLQEQRLLCEGGGCSGFPVSNKDPWAPWTGSWGLNPLEFVFNGFNSFNCDCNNNPNCDFEVTECLYEYNPYLCEFYDIVMPGQFQYNGVWEDNPHQDNQDLVLAFRFSALDVPANADVTWCWELPAGFNNTVTCVGCTQTPVNNCVKQGNSIVLKIANASLEDLTVNPEDFKVTATADFIECGTVEKEFTMQVQLKHIINTDTANCEKMVFEVKEAWHIDGNVYDWDFPLYDALASVSNGGRRVEFNTESVIQQTSPTTNPEKKLEYSLTVSNPSYTSELEVNGEQEIPDCRYGGLGLMVYPNPATDAIFLEFEGVQPNEETLDVYIFDHQFNRMGRELYALKGQSIDVTRLNNGLYFLCAVTKEGKMFTRKFCIGRH
jgi:hypothetical protein